MKTSLSALILVTAGALGCSTTPTPAASAASAASSGPEVQAPAATCQTLAERYEASPGRALDRLADMVPVLAAYEGSSGMSTASAISQTTYALVDPLGVEGDVTEHFKFIDSGPRSPRHPNVEPARGLIDMGRARAEARGQLYLVLLDPATREAFDVVPAADDREARAMAELVRSGTCWSGAR
jgi:hypothetical protein